MNHTDRKFFVVFLQLTILLAAASCSAQQRSSFASPDAVKKLLLGEDARAVGRLSVHLGLRAAVTGSACSSFEQANLLPVQLSGKASSQLLILHAPLCETVFLLPFSRQGQRWRTLPPLAFSSRYNPPQLRLKKLLSREEEFLLVEHLTVDGGSGVQQRNCQIYRLTPGGLQLVFNQPESLHVTVPLGHGAAVWEEEQTSVFDFFRAPAAAPASIREKRTTRCNGQSLTVYRSYLWDNSLGSYLMLGAGPAEVTAPTTPPPSPAGQ